MSAAASGARRGKKRKVSSAKDGETVASGRQEEQEEQPEIRDEAAVSADAGQSLGLSCMDTGDL